MISELTIQLLNKGDERALAEIYEYYKPILEKSYLYFKVDSLSRSSAINKALIFIWNSRGKITCEDHLRSYLLSSLRLNLKGENRTRLKYFDRFKSNVVELRISPKASILPFVRVLFFLMLFSFKGFYPRFTES